MRNTVTSPTLQAGLVLGGQWAVLRSMGDGSPEPKRLSNSSGLWGQEAIAIGSSQGDSQDAETPGARGRGRLPSTENRTSATILSPTFQTKVKVKDSQLLGENARRPWWRPCKASPELSPGWHSLASPEEVGGLCPGSTVPWGSGNRLFEAYRHDI